MITQWCYTRDGRITHGPVTWEELKHMAATGELLPTDVVGEIGMAKPVRAEKVGGLFDTHDGRDATSARRGPVPGPFAMEK